LDAASLVKDGRSVVALLPWSSMGQAEALRRRGVSVSISMPIKPSHLARALMTSRGLLVRELEATGRVRAVSMRPGGAAATKRILLAEDNAVNQKVVVGMLE